MSNRTNEFGMLVEPSARKAAMARLGTTNIGGKKASTPSTPPKSPPAPARAPQPTAPRSASPPKPGEPPTADLLDVGTLGVDHDYQRFIDNPSSEKLIARIVDAFDWQQYGALSVALDPDGNWFVFEGQHRLEVARRLGIRKVPCLIYENMPKRDQARASDGMNTMKKPHAALEKFKIRVAAEIEPEFSVAKLADELGIVIPPAPRSRADMKPGMCMATGLLGEYIEDPGHKVLKRALEVLMEGRPDDPLNLRASVIMAVVEILRVNEHELDDDRLKRALSKEKSIRDLEVRADALKEAYPNLTRRVVIRRALAIEYNKGLPEDRRIVE